MTRFVHVEYEGLGGSSGGNRRKVEVAPLGEPVRYGEGLVIVNGLQERLIVPLARLFAIKIDNEQVSVLAPKGANHD